jgi:protein gp37
VPARGRFLSIEPMLGPIDLEAMPFGPPCTGCGEPVHLDALSGVTSCIYACDGPAFSGIDWVICGGESGPKARPMHPDWSRSLRDQCKDASVPFLFKQWGEWRPMQIQEVPKRGGLTVRLISDGSRPPVGDGCFHAVHQLESMVIDPAYGWQVPVLQLGKKAAGRLLDGVTHDGFPA